MANPNFLPTPFISGFGNPGALGGGVGMGAGSFNGGQVMNPMPSMSLNPIFNPAEQAGLSSMNKALGASGSNGWFGIEGLGKNLNTLKMGVGGLQTIAGIWNASQQNKLARDSFNFNKGLLDTNLKNSITAYNTNVDDKYRSRAAFEGMSDADRDAAIAKAQARDYRKG